MSREAQVRFWKGLGCDSSGLLNLFSRTGESSPLALLFIGELDSG
jgi:hypothetical protein